MHDKILGLTSILNTGCAFRIKFAFSASWYTMATLDGIELLRSNINGRRSVDVGGVGVMDLQTWVMLLVNWHLQC
jgi:hypothetical protein